MALSASQIVGLATQTAHCPGFIVQGGQFLNLTLADIVDTQDLELLSANVSVPLTAAAGMGPYTLPLAYRRAMFGGVYYGNKQKLEGYSRDQFNALDPTVAAGPPVYYFADLSPLATYPASAPALSVWPKPDTDYALTVNYYQILADITAPESSTVVPWFPNQKYLWLRTTAHLMDLVDDTRADDFHGRADEQMAAYLTYANDDENHVKTAARDTRRAKIGI